MSAEDLLLQLQKLTLDEYRLTTQLREKGEEIERVRARIVQQQQTGESVLGINDRVRILNPKFFSPITKGWNEKEEHARITAITYETDNPQQVKHYKLTTDNGTKTWRKPKNLTRLG